MEDFPVVSVVGYSGAGKTTFLEKLIAEMKKRGYHVGTVKHTSHYEELDSPGKDSWRHARAGSEVTVLAAPNGLRLVKEVFGLTPAEVLAQIKDVDIVFTEGYKQEKWPKVLVYCNGSGTLPDVLPSGLLAVVSDVEIDAGVPLFDPEDATGVADLIEREVIRVIAD